MTTLDQMIVKDYLAASEQFKQLNYIYETLEDIAYTQEDMNEMEEKDNEQSKFNQ